MQLSIEQVRAAGGIQQSDGSVFFPSIDKLNAALALAYMGSVQDSVATAVQDILAERSRQIKAEGYTTSHDDEHSGGELAAASAAYAFAAAERLHPMSIGHKGFTAEDPPVMMPVGWDFKPGEPRRMLIKSAALAMAQVGVIDRAAALQPA